jgi:hypothetical protein
MGVILLWFTSFRYFWVLAGGFSRLRDDLRIFIAEKYWEGAVQA